MMPDFADKESEIILRAIRVPGFLIGPAII